MKKLLPDNIKKLSIYVLAAFILFNLIRIIKMVLDNTKAGLNTVAIKGITGVTPSDVLLCKNVALKCYDAIYNYSFGMFENESGFIDALNELSTSQQAKATSMFYAQMAKKTSIKADMFKYLLPIEYTDIKTLIRSNIQ